MSEPFRPPSTLRPEFLAILGLVPPISVEDVKQAYLEKVKTMHPDHGGDSQQFMRLHEAFEQATEYARFKSSRSQWLGQWVEQYAQQQILIDDLKARGGSIEVESVDWLTQSIGPDFATVLDQVVSLRLSGPAVDDAELARLAAERRLLAGLRKLELIDTKVTSRGLGLLKIYQNLEQLDLTGTRISLEAVQVLVPHLPKLQSIVLRNTGIGWWALKKFGLSHRRLSVTA